MARRVRPHFRIHVSIDSHPKTAAIWADPVLRSCYVGLGRLGIEKYAGKTGDRFLCSTAELAVVLGCDQGAAAVKRLKRLCRVAFDSAVEAHALGRSKTADPSVWFEVVERQPGHDHPASIADSRSQLVAESVSRVGSESGPSRVRVGSDCRKFYLVGIRNFERKQGLSPARHVDPNTEHRTPNTDEHPDTSRRSPEARDPAAGKGSKVDIGEGCFWLAAHLRRRILEAFPDRPKVPAETETKLRPWAREIERMIRIDGREPEKIRAAIDWALGPNLQREASFVILSAKALRSKYDSMSIAARREVDYPNGRGGKGKTGSVAQGAARVLSTMERVRNR